MVIFGLASAVAWLLPGRYESKTVVRVERTEIPHNQAEAEKKLSALANARLREISDRVLTQEKLLGLIDRFDLYREKKAEASPGELEKMMRNDMQITLIDVDADAPGQGQADHVSILFSVVYLGDTSETAHNVADALAAFYLEDDIRFREQQQAEARDAMETALFNMRERIYHTEERAVQYRLEHMEYMPEHADLNLQAKAEVDRQAMQAMDDARTLKGRESSLQNRLDTVSPGDPSYNSLVKSLEAVRSKLGAIGLVIQEKQKKSIALRRRIDDAEIVDREYKALEARRTALQDEYDEMLHKAEADAVAFEIEKSKRGEHYSIVEEARLTKRSVNQNAPIILLAGLVAGLGAGLVLAMLRNSMDGGLRSIEQAASALPYPVLAAIPALCVPGEVPKRNIGKTLVKGAILCAAVCLLLFIVLWWQQ